MSLIFPPSGQIGEESEDDLQDDAEEDLLSEDELKKDNVRDKERDVKRKLKKKKNGEIPKEEDLGMGEGFFDETTPFEPAQSFHEMNLSRPLMKAIASMNFVHPTPIQSATIPVALLGRDICGCAATGYIPLFIHSIYFFGAFLFAPFIILIGF